MCKYLLYGLLLTAAGFYTDTANAQTEDQSFKSTQLSSPRVAAAVAHYTDTLAKAFNKKNLSWPPKDIYIRAFKSQNDLELWARGSETGEYKLIKTYRICAISGLLGPKRYQGDRQVPEGYYFIEEFNPKSDYHLSLLLNYPNFSDQSTGKDKLGGEIYIHGGCVTVGCMPMTDEGIQEIYTVCLQAKLNGQENIPVHIFPTRLTKTGMAYLYREFTNDQNRQQFWSSLKTGYEYFEKNHKLLPVMYTPDGKYTN